MCGFSVYNMEYKLHEKLKAISKTGENMLQTDFNKYKYKSHTKIVSAVEVMVWLVGSYISVCYLLYIYMYTVLIRWV